ncbi:hypothetical protein EVAR_18702_1 [Eumeta japonica]|uniref:Uncharacterized protein n=1 Tax=Eumeta variegata TaxID=151549 RepID=A0A4C1U6V5_EUMVA|nr:hypothetical protein EVAR_18702_1 [Eumeta japonica]
MSLNLMKKHRCTRGSRRRAPAPVWFVTGIRVLVRGRAAPGRESSGRTPRANGNASAYYSQISREAYSVARDRCEPWSGKNTAAASSLVLLTLGLADEFVNGICK